jgi:pilus assembly protein CpaE
MRTLTFVTMGREPETVKQISEALTANGSARVLASYNNAPEMLANIPRLRPSAAVVTLIPEHLENSFTLIKELVAAAPETVIISASKEASPNMILGSMRAGAREFLQLPTTQEELKTVLGRISEFCAHDETTARQGNRTIAVFSAKGGAGVSFFATNLAAAMNKQTLLVDLNLQAGDSASFLGLDAKYSLIDFVRNLSRLDDALISSLVTQHSPNLALVAAPTEAHEAEEIRAEETTEILYLLNKKYEVTVLDLPHSFDPVTIAALDTADDILIVMTLDIPGIRSTKRALKVFADVGYPREKIRVIVNRWSKGIDVQLQKVEGHLGERLIGFVPNDYRKVMDSINLGRPLVQDEPGSKISLEIKRIASLITENVQKTSTQPRKRLLRSVFGNKSTSTALELSTLTDNA